MVPRGRARNAFLENGAGFCLRPDESGAAQPAYATPECDSEGPVATAAQVETAVGLPPQTTRARLRGLFIKTAKDHQRDFTIDWVHLKLNDTANPTVRCLDPLNANFELARRLIAIAGS
jgi:proteasome accessory factor A